MELRILQWNVWFKQDIVKVVEVLKAIDADIVCLQELTRGYIGQTHENTWEYIAHELGYSFQVQEIPITTPEAQWSQANAIFSRFPITSKAAHWIHTPVHPDDPTDQYRGCLLISVLIRETIYTIATTHMSFREIASDDPEAHRLNKIIKPYDKRLILTGDTNATPDSARMRLLSSVLVDTGPAHEVNTWPTKPYIYNNVSIPLLSSRYDYILATSDMAVTETQVIETDVSDHLPIQTTFVIT